MPDTTLADETEVKEYLTEWLHENGCRVFWEENTRDYPTFTVSGTGGEKPDLLVLTDSHTLAVEVKHNGSNSTVYDAHPQTIRYWRQLSAATYTAGSDVYHPDGVVTATQATPDGRLFKLDDDTPISEYGERREDVIARGDLPLIEHTMTEQFIRLLWRYANAQNGPEDRYVGALLSTFLNADSGAVRPAVLWNNYDESSWQVIS